MSIATLNPATGQLVRTFDELTDEQIDQKLELAARAFHEHRSGSLEQRARALVKAADLLDAERKQWARVMVEEMGKTFASALAELEKCSRTCRYYAEHAPRFLADEPLPKDDTECFIRYLPLGPVLAVMPWNFPFWQVFRFAAPALMAGNVGLLKHASNVPQCALAIEDIFRRAGFPDGVFQTLLIGSKKVGRVIADPRVAAVTLTGSAAAGAQVAAEAGAKLKKTVLELGGSDPFIVMPSADLEVATKVAVVARNINNGQSCIAAKRFIVHRDVYARFEATYVSAVEKLKVGDPMREDVDIGPLATEQGLSDVERQVRESVARGARLLTGGRRLEGPGFYYAPTVLAKVPPDAPAWREEVFGPVAVLVEAKDVDDAIRLANDCEYGLGTSVWTRDPDEQRRFIDGLEAGMTFVNAMVASDPRLPFGGVKHSGYGRELSWLGIREFVNAKTVSINRGHAWGTTISE
ncbi:MAG: NAD-dependent succinate-semialdehyde dehydrogenase [Myxococcaceae bacterium]|nr:NAD-dependent succinate-semialdehyde dehydrogenase [Myxococcaceae bacterium]